MAARGGVRNSIIITRRQRQREGTNVITQIAQPFDAQGRPQMMGWAVIPTETVESWRNRGMPATLPSEVAAVRLQITDSEDRRFEHKTDGRRVATLEKPRAGDTIWKVDGKPDMSGYVICQIEELEKWIADGAVDKGTWIAIQNALGNVPV
jgi:hypothetical protein